MNACELAEIMEIHDGSQIWEHGLEIANMLRQQADKLHKYELRNQEQIKRIAELEKQVKFLEEKCVMVEPLDDSHYPFRKILKGL